MSIPNLNLPSVQQKIERAKEYSNIIKEYARLFNEDVDSIIKSIFSEIREAVRSNDDIDNILDRLLEQIRENISLLISQSIDTACKRENEDSYKYGVLFPLTIAQCSIAYYEGTLNKYRKILENEISFAIDEGYADDMIVFLSNPQAYVANKKRGLLDLKSNINGISSGVSYSFTENIKKLGISVAALSYTNAEMYFWENNKNIVGYFGNRNSNYPCPLCDEYANIFIPMSQGMIYPLHNRCVCAVIPLSQNELI